MLNKQNVEPALMALLDGWERYALFFNKTCHRVIGDAGDDNLKLAWKNIGLDIIKLIDYDCGLFNRNSIIGFMAQIFKDNGFGEKIE